MVRLARAIHDEHQTRSRATTGATGLRSRELEVASSLRRLSPAALTGAAALLIARAHTGHTTVGPRALLPTTCAGDPGIHANSRVEFLALFAHGGKVDLPRPHLREDI